jgi:hydroxymethylglutaryl-CoA synthase
MIENVVKTFYDGLKSKKFMGLKCSKCGNVSFPPKPTCNKCGNFKTLKWIKLSGKGKVLYYNVENFPGGEFQKIAPYATGLIHMKEGVPIMTIVNGVNLKDPWAGNMKCPLNVQAGVKKVGSKRVIVFNVVKKK